MDFQVCRPQKTRVLCHLKEKWNLRHTFGHCFLTWLVCFLTSYLANEWYYTACWLTSLFQIISTNGGYKEHCTMCCVGQSVQDYCNTLSVEFTGCKWHYLGCVVELCYYPHYFSMLVPTFRFFQLVLIVSRSAPCALARVRLPLSLSTATWTQNFDFFVARVMRKLYSGNGPFSHILCSFFGLSADI